MKRVTSVSLGSAKRDSATCVNLFGEEFEISRVGTNGDFWKAVYQIRRLDGYVDTIGLGGIDRYIYTQSRCYTVRDGDFLARNAWITPVVDGSGLKNTLERKTIIWLQENGIIDFTCKKVLIVCAVDRFGMAQTINELAQDVIFGDIMFTLGIPIPIHRYRTLCGIGDILLPIIVKLPFQWLYPIGKKQETIKPRFGRFFSWADIICGDWHIIRRNLPTPESGLMQGKTIITNTITQNDIQLLSERQLGILVTTTPEYDGRHFATNVLEGIFIAHLGKKPEDTTPEDYQELLDEMGYQPKIKYLTPHLI